MFSKTNFVTGQPKNTPEPLKDPENLQRIAALGSFIFVRGGSLFQEFARRGIDVRPGDSYT